MVAANATHLAFTMPRREIDGRILIPKYYDPDLKIAEGLAAEDFDLPELADILLPGEAGSSLGRYLPREYYGTGEVPYVRTSDLANWRVRPDVKKGVSLEIYKEFGRRQTIEGGDLLLVAHGTYLVGTVAIVTASDLPMLLQDHVFRLRVSEKSGLASELVLAALSTAFVQRQVRSRQFSAEIIDKLGERHLGVKLPIPKDAALAESIVLRVRDILDRQSKAHRDIQRISASSLRMTRERAEAHYGFAVPRRVIRHRILIPKYYDPEIEDLVSAAENADGARWASVGELVATGSLHVTTGVEVGKMAYGTGSVPFIRTSDLVAWEVKRVTKQGISRDYYTEHAVKASLEPHDILLVRDGTYLVGSSALVTRDDVPALFSGGLFRIRCLEPDVVNPFALLAALNHPLVRRQMRSKQFTRDVIDTLGTRLLEVRLPTKSLARDSETAREVSSIMSEKAELKRAIGTVLDALEPPSPSLATGRPGWSMR